MKTRKLIAGVAAMACAFTFGAAPVEAAVSTGSIANNNVSADGTYEQVVGMNPAVVETPTILITVPTSGVEFTLNPYKLKVAKSAAYATDHGTTAGADIKIEDKIASNEYQMDNDSNVPVGVGLSSFVGTEQGEVVLGTKAPTDKDTAKTAFVYIEMNKTESYNKASTYDKANKNQLLLGTTDITAAKQDMVVMDAGDGTAGSETKHGYFIFRGDVNSHPAKEYDSNDKIGTTMKLCFRPVLPTE